MSKKIIVITGGARGLGLSLADYFAQLEWRVIILDKNSDQFQSLQEKFDCYQADVTDEQSVVDIVTDVISKYGKIDALINNAAIIFNKPLINIMHASNMRHSYAEFKKNVDINLNSVFLMSSVISEQMIKTRTKGNIINISSICAKGNAGQSADSAAKAGVDALTKVWAKELGPFGIRVNAVAPGFIETQSTHAALNPKVLDHIIQNTPLKRLGQPENICKAIDFLLNNDFVTGNILDVNGGLVI